MKIQLFLSALAATFIVGCGGSSSGGGDDTTTPDTSGTGGETPSSITNIEYIAGVYDISDGDNVVYLSINEAGLIATYDYQGDTVDNGLNCYGKNLATSFNTDINGLTVVNDEANKQFTVDGGLAWYYGDDQNISKVTGFNGGISAGAVLTFNGSKIATSVRLIDTVTVNDMEQLLCE